MTELKIFSMQMYVLAYMFYLICILIFIIYFDLFLEIYDNSIIGVAWRTMEIQNAFL